ncbi:MAG: tetratricopeptide repeat protein [Firmicutes bacterium]|nr:tetratricopeptide repeat protein [Bacillota bacterium]
MGGVRHGIADGAANPMPMNNEVAERQYRINRLMEVGKLDEARSELDALQELEGDSAFVLNKLGVIAVRSGDLEQGKAYFEKALAVDESYVQAYNNLGNIYREMGDLDRAIECYQLALKYDGEYATAHHNLGVVYKQKGDIHKSVQHLKQANRLQTVMARRELAQSPLARKKPIAWLLIAVLVGLLLLYRTKT